jgi:predicted GNAT superfamily acetyltransferase
VPDVDVRQLDTPEQMRAGVQLYRAVFSLGSEDPAVNTRLLTALRHNGGVVLGAWGGGQLVGFIYGFLGRDGDTGTLHHYSQMAVVDPAWQGRGVGRALKLAQRDLVLSQGIERMRWSFDPLRTRNGRFNLDVLGARGRWFLPNLYGVERTGRDAGRRTDRIVVEWDLPASRRGAVPVVVPAPPALLPWAEITPTGDDLLLAVPASPSVAAAGGPESLPRVQQDVADALQKLLDGRHVAVSCQPADESTAVYRFRAVGS